MKLSLILLTGLGAAAALGRRPAAVRHWVLAVAVMCAAAMPLAERALPGFPMTVPMASRPDVATEVSVDVSIGGTSPRGLASPSRTAGFDWITAVWLCGATFSLLVLAAGLARLMWLSRRARPAAAQLSSPASARARSCVAAAVRSGSTPP